MGGIGIFVGFIAPMILIHLFSHQQKGIMLGAGITLLIGAMDDIRRLPGVVKLVCLGVVTIIAQAYGVVTRLPISPELNLLVTLLWITGLTSAMNALDHMDGLAGGVAVIAASMFLFVSIQTEQYFWGLVSVCLIGSLLGYLVFNCHPATIFMGDSGSFFLGFTLAAIGVMGDWSTNPVKAAIVPIAILSLPIFDLVYLIVTRRLNGTTKSLMESINYCGKDHIGHRLMSLGFSVRRSVRAVYLIAAVIGFAALLLRNTNTWEAILILIQIVFMYLIIVTLMARKR